VISCFEEAPYASQQVALQEIRRAIKEDSGPTEAQPSPEAALRALLRERGGYGGDGVRGEVAPYTRGNPSLPKGRIHLKELTAHLPPELAQLLKDPVHGLLLPEEDRRRAVAESEVTLYMDPVLKADPAAYGDYLASLHQAGMLRWDLAPCGLVTPFFCVKEAGSPSLRALFDCRLANLGFRPADFTHLVTVEGLSRIRVPYGHSLWAAGGDLRNYYYQ